MALTKVTTKSIKDGEIVNADVNASAAIAGSKIDPNFGSQNIVTTGNVGIGNTNPGSFHSSGENLVIGSGSGDEGMTVYSGNSSKGVINFADSTSGSDSYEGRIIYDHSDNSIRFHVNNGSERMRIDSSGKVGIGTTTAGDGGLHQLTIGDSSHTGITLRGGTSSNANIYFADGTSGTDEYRGYVQYQHGSDVLAFGTSSSERIRIDSSGRVLINTTSTLASEGFLQVACNSNTDGVQFHCTDNSSTNILEMKHGSATGSDTGTMIAFRRADGNMVGSISSNTSATAYNTSSDYRLKENVTAISDGITRLKTLKPSKFNFIGDSKIIDGFLAHEVTAVPEAISGTKDEVDSDNKPVYQQIDQSKLVPLLTAALQEAIAKIETLETKVAALEAA